MVADEQEKVMNEYADLLASFPRDSAVRKEERRRYIEFQDPANFRYETTDAAIGWYEDGIKRLMAALP